MPKGWRERWWGFAGSQAPTGREVVYRVNGIRITSGVKDLVDEAVSEAPMTAIRQHGSVLKEIVQRCRDGEPVSAVKEAYEGMIGVGHHIYYVSFFLIRNTPEEYHEIFRG